MSWKASKSGLLTLKGNHSFVCWPGGTQTFYDVMGGGGRECLAGVSSASGGVIGSGSASSVEVIPPLLCGQICYLQGSTCKTIAPFDRERALQQWQAAPELHRGVLLVIALNPGSFSPTQSTHV